MIRLRRPTVLRVRPFAPFLAGLNFLVVLLAGFRALDAVFFAPDAVPLAAGLTVVFLTADVVLLAADLGAALVAGLVVVFLAVDVVLLIGILGTVFVVVVLLLAGLDVDFKGDDCGTLATGLGVGFENVCGVILAIGPMSFE